jgi:cobalt-zinc-cadmium efflux system membrane fusion protein
MKRRLLAVGIALVVIVAIAVTRTVRRPPPVQVAKARVGTLELRIAASGLVETESQDLSFRASGEIVAVYAREGDPVRRGQVLARVVQVNGPATGSTGEDVIHAPWDGSVVEIYLRRGAVAAAGVPVLRVASSQTPWVTAFVDADDAVYIRTGSALQCRAGGYLSRGWELRVERVGGEAVARQDLPGSARQVRVRCQPTDATFAIPPGTEVDIDGTTPLVHEAVVVPASSVVRDGPVDSVWVLDGDVVRRRPVTLGPNNFDEIEVVSGLSAGETVVVEGKDGLSDGQRVKATPMPPIAPRARARRG